MIKTVVFILLLILFIPRISEGQTDATNELKPFNSLYLNKKINYRWSIDLYSLIAFKSMSYDFWLMQFNLGANYKINRFYAFSFGYGHALYNSENRDWWGRHYPDLNPNSLNTVSFHSLNLMLKRDDKLGRNFKLSNRIIYQQYFPEFEKYKIRLQYLMKLNYRRSNLPITMRPFIQAAIYYYLNGVPINYYDENFNIIKTAPPNGLHRYRLKLGTSLKPIESNRKLSAIIYFAINREFNVNGLGNDINVPRPSRSGNKIFTSYQFNNYSILGIQVNYFL